MLIGLVPFVMVSFLGVGSRMEYMMQVKEYIAELVLAQLYNRKPMSIPEGIDIQEIMVLSRKHHMDYMILGALLRTDNLSEEYIPVLRKCVMNSIFRSTTQITQFNELIKRLEEKQVKNQPMKGALLKFIYPTPELREMSDIDILIHKDGWERGVEVLKEMGYELHESIKHHDIYVKKPYMVIEAHRAMYDKTVDYNQYEYFKNMSKAVLREGYEYSYDFTIEDFYIYMISHMAKHFYAMGCGIRNLVDIYVYRKKFGESMDIGYLCQEFEKLGLSAFVKNMEKLADIWLGGAKGDEFFDDLFYYMLDSGIYGKDENGIWNKFCEESKANKTVSRLQLRMWYWFPPLYYMSEYYPYLEEKPYLLPWAWIVRGVNGILKKKGTYKRQMIHDINQDSIKTNQKIYSEMQLRFK